MLLRGVVTSGYLPRRLILPVGRTRRRSVLPFMTIPAPTLGMAMMAILFVVTGMTVVVRIGRHFDSLHGIPKNTHVRGADTLFVVVLIQVSLDEDQSTLAQAVNYCRFAVGRKPGDVVPDGGAVRAMCGSTELDRTTPFRLGNDFAVTTQPRLHRDNCEIVIHRRSPYC